MNDGHEESDTEPSHDNNQAIENPNSDSSIKDDEIIRSVSTNADKDEDLKLIHKVTYLFLPPSLPYFIPRYAQNIQSDSSWDSSSTRRRSSTSLATPTNNLLNKYLSPTFFNPVNFKRFSVSISLINV
jgi:hypothetical protein